MPKTAKATTAKIAMIVQSKASGSSTSGVVVWVGKVVWVDGAVWVVDGEGVCWFVVEGVFVGFTVEVGAGVDEGCEGVGVYVGGVGVGKGGGVPVGEPTVSNCAGE